MVLLCYFPEFGLLNCDNYIIYVDLSGSKLLAILENKENKKKVVFIGNEKVNLQIPYYIYN